MLEKLLQTPWPLEELFFQTWVANSGRVRGKGHSLAVHEDGRPTDALRTVICKNDIFAVRNDNLRSFHEVQTMVEDFGRTLRCDAMPMRFFLTFITWRWTGLELLLGLCASGSLAWFVLRKEGNS